MTIIISQSMKNANFNSREKQANRRESKSTNSTGNIKCPLRSKVPKGNGGG